MNGNIVQIITEASYSPNQLFETTEEIRKIKK